MNRLAVVVSLVFVCVGIGAGQKTPDETVAGLKAAPGLELKLWASDPMLSNPSDLTIDERGRVWVLEAVNYRRMLGSQPNIRPAGNRILILDDTDHDGRADTVKVFDQNPDIRSPLGIAVLGDKVYVSQSPNLTVYTKDADDRILKKEVLLTGFGGVDHDHGLHALVFGPDGKYYFNNGNTGFDVTDRSGTHLQIQGTGANAKPGYYEGTVMRMNADGTGLEVLAQNFRNPYELTLDSFGTIFQTDNDDDGNAWTRLLYVMPGGNYGFRGPLNRTWTEDRGSHWHTEVPGVAPLILRLGAGAPCGIVLYEGRLLPEAYRGQLLHAEAGKRIIAAYPMANDGAGYSARSEDVVTGGDDTWFRPSDVAVAPDGSVFISDWYDPGVGGHQMGDAQGARGRIYRLAPPGAKSQVPALDLQAPAGLTAAFASPNQSVRYLAHQALVAQGRAALPLLQTLWHGADPILRARALWILGGQGDVGERAIQEGLRDRDFRFRIEALRVAHLGGANMLALSKPLWRDPSPQVRREILLSLQDPSRMVPPYLTGDQTAPSAEWLDAMTSLASQYDGVDRWYLDAIGIAARAHEDAFYARLKSDWGGKPSVRFDSLVWELRPKAALADVIAAVNDPSRNVQERTRAVQTLGSMQWPEAARAMEALVTAGRTPGAVVAPAFALYAHQLFSLWSDARTAPALPAVMRRALVDPASQRVAVSLADGLGDPQFIPDLVILAKSSAAAPEARAAALELVATARDATYLSDFEALAATGPTPVRVSAVRAVATLGQPGVEAWAQQVLQSEAPNEVRVEALRLLNRSSAGVTAILDLAEQNKLPVEFRRLATTLTNSAQAGRGGGAAGGGRGFGAVGRGAAGRGVAPDPALAAIRERAARVLPPPAPSSAAPITSARTLDLSYRGNAAMGRKVFEAEAGCAACHSVGGTRKLGPDLSAIGAKYGKQALLDNILNPSDAIAPEYVVTVIDTNDGGSVVGIVTEDTADRVVVKTGSDQERRLKPSDIRARQPSHVSLMPEGLLNALTPQQAADLLEFLSTLNASAASGK